VIPKNDWLGLNFTGLESANSIEAKCSALRVEQFSTQVIIGMHHTRNFQIPICWQVAFLNIGPSLNDFGIELLAPIEPANGDVPACSVFGLHVLAHRQQFLDKLLLYIGGTHKQT
jgi:hypothetical protein